MRSGQIKVKIVSSRTLVVYSVFGLLSFISNVPLSGTFYDSLFMSHPKITYLRLSESDWWKIKKFRPRGLSTRGYQNLNMKILTVSNVLKLNRTW